MNPVCFVDFDGCLHPKGENTRDEYGPVFDPYCVQNLRKIVRATNPDIVISSDWRKEKDLHTLQVMWNERALPGRVVDVTSISPDRFRGREIRAYLQHHPYERYCIIDDLNDFFKFQKPHLVHCNPQFGLSETDAARAIQILTQSRLTGEANDLPMA